MAYITVRRAVELIEARTGFRVSQSAIYRWIKEGYVSTARVGSRVLLDEDDLATLLAFSAKRQKEKGGQV